MPWLSIILWSISLIGSYSLVPFIKLLTWYLICTLGAITLRILYKLRSEVFNEDLKYKRTECKDRIVVVTGATSGIGLAAAKHFYTKGFVVMACYYSKDEPGYEELNLLTGGLIIRGQEKVAATSDSCSMYLIKLNVKSRESIKNCYNQVISIMADRPELQLHALVNVAGVGYYHKFQWMLRDQIENMVMTNLLGAMWMTREFLHLLIGKVDSRIVNVASAMAYIPVEFGSAYGGTKAGLTQFTNALEADLARHGVKAVTIQPGNLTRNTSILNSSMETKVEKIIPELNDDEKRIYKLELEQHKQRMESFERALQKSTSVRLSFQATLKSNLRRAAHIVTGAVDGTQLHLNTSFIQSFDNSVRLRDPSREIFAGNIFFNIVISSVFEWTPRALLGYLIPLLLKDSSQM